MSVAQYVFLMVSMIGKMKQEIVYLIEEATKRER